MGLFNRKVTAATKLKAFLERSENIDVRVDELSTNPKTKAIGSLHPSQAEDLLFTLALSLPNTPPQEFVDIIQTYANGSGKFVMLKEIFVTKEERNQRIGSALLSVFRDKARELGATHIFALAVENDENPFDLARYYYFRGFAPLLPANEETGSPALMVLDLS